MKRAFIAPWRRINLRLARIDDWRLANVVEIQESTAGGVFIQPRCGSADVSGSTDAADRTPIRAHLN